MRVQSSNTASCSGPTDGRMVCSATSKSRSWIGRTWSALTVLSAGPSSLPQPSSLQSFPRRSHRVGAIYQTIAYQGTFTLSLCGELPSTQISLSESQFLQRKVSREHESKLRKVLPDKAKSLISSNRHLGDWAPRSATTALLQHSALLSRLHGGPMAQCPQTLKSYRALRSSPMAASQRSAARLLPAPEP